MTEQLKPCPFTGEKPKHGLTKGSRDMHGDLNQNYQVWTKYTRITAADKERAFEIWNTRPSATPGNTDPIAKYDDELRKVQGGWRDMDDPALEQIKRDGTAILAFGHAGTAQSIWFAEQTGQWHTTWHGMESIFRNPTHWMPLPPAPTEHPTEQPSVKVAENGEVCTSPIRSKNHNGEEVVSFDERHTLADIARWISENPVDRDEMVHLLTGGQMKQPSVRDAGEIDLSGSVLLEYQVQRGDAGLFHLYGSDGVFVSRKSIQECLEALPVLRKEMQAALRSLAQEGE